jgi:hypothetical protein
MNKLLVSGFVITDIKLLHADLCGRAVRGVGLRPLTFWDCGFESHREMSVCLSVCYCCVLSGRCLSDGLITRPEESYRLWGVV